MNLATLLNGRDAADYGRVAVCCGGQSAEREISLMSGAATLAALLERGVEVEQVELDRAFMQRAIAGQFDRVFIAAHGRGGEDGALQGFLDLLGLPYSGSSAAASAIGMDKHLCKTLWLAAGLPTPDWTLVANESELYAAAERFGLPLIVKPTTEGSSVGITLVEQKAQIGQAWISAAACGAAVMAEAYIDGTEITASLLLGEALPLVEIRPVNRFYDYEAKYQSDETRYICPVELGIDLQQKVKAIAQRAFQAIGAAGWGRVDLMLDVQQRPWLVEVNTVPGLTSHSLVPMAASEAGFSFAELIELILLTSCGVDDVDGEVVSGQVTN
ncbi:MAG TPA: D-alanine--D-alanine ligase [Gammaproteobacteria bacterium]|nr:D-alanine--D-alanine ligase [Gammaproteobacteria bacterium]